MKLSSQIDVAEWKKVYFHAETSPSSSIFVHTASSVILFISLKPEVDVTYREHCIKEMLLSSFFQKGKIGEQAQNTNSHRSNEWEGFGCLISVSQFSGRAREALEILPASPLAAGQTGASYTCHFFWSLNVFKHSLFLHSYFCIPSTEQFIASVYAAEKKGIRFFKTEY